MAPGSPEARPRCLAVRLRLGMVAALLLGALSAAVSPAASAAEERPVIDPEVRTAVASGSARVLVELRLPGGVTVEGELSPAAAAAQRAAIAATQRDVLARLAGTHVSVSRQYTSLPLLGLEIDAAALAALESMGDLVTRVRLDAIRAPSGGASPPHP